VGDVYLESNGFKKLFEKINQLPQVVYKDMGETILTVTLLVEAAAKANVKKNFKGIGTLADSITHKILKVAGLAVTGVVGTNLAYAAIHEFGGTITPKNANWLTIPFAGVKGRARDYDNTFFAWSKNKHLILFQRVGKDEVIPLFVLVKESEVPARPYLNPALEQNREIITQRIGEALKRSLERVTGK
jgi:phage gpG-like protein